MSTTITAPDSRYTGTSDYGPVRLEFKDGVATFDGDLSDGLRGYLQANGFGLDGAAVTPAPAPEPADPRDHDTPELVGTDLRDAAVDPRDTDFLPPTNAGQANPHGPDVVSPGIHAIESHAVVPGAVGSWGTDKDGLRVVVEDTEAQAAKETAFAQDVLTSDDEPVADALKAVDDNPPEARPTVDETAAGDVDTAALFDPGDHTVAEVKAYLETADDTERDRVLTAERAGKARAGLLS